jgi:hypothetical protein
VTVVTAKIQVRRGTAAEWAAANPVLAQGEMSYETDTGLTKVGDGATEYADLPAYATYDQMVQALEDAQEIITNGTAQIDGIVEAGTEQLTGIFNGAEKQVALASGHRVNAEAARDAAIAAQNIASQQATIATSQASLAEGHAASAASVVQQDLSGVTAQALHRSPNAVTAMFIYDTSKDSDGGAWTEKCQHTSWWNEAINGKWLGALNSETEARYMNAVLSDERVANGDFSSATGWSFSNITIVDGAASLVAASASKQINQTITSVPNGSVVLISYTVRSVETGGAFQVRFEGVQGVNRGISSPGTYAEYFVKSGSSLLQLTTTGTNTFVGIIDNISVREVTTLVTQPGDYFQLTTDGAFYALSKNLLASTATLATQTQFLSAGTYTLSSATASSGSVAVSGAATASHTAGGSATTFTVATSGNVTFTVTGSVLTAQCEAGSVASTYQANGTARTVQVFRGNKRDFPRLAGIVGEPQHLAIYDLTELGCPMWMRFIGWAGSGALGFSNTHAVVRSLAAMQGQILVGHLNSTLNTFDFARDDMKISNTGAGWGLTSGREIANRNKPTTYRMAGDDGYGLSSTSVAAIAMTVLQDAPVDPATGLRVPTIALALGSRVNLIKHNGSVVSNNLNSSFDAITLTPTLLSAGRADGTWYYAANPGALGASFALTTRTNTQAPGFGIGNTGKLVDMGRARLLRRSTTSARAQIARAHESDPARSLIATVGNDHNTGWMPGDIRRTFLSDTGAGSVTGTELVTNGDFSSSSGWTLTGGISVSISDGVCTWSAASLSNDRIERSLGMSLGKVYLVTITVTSYTSGGVKAVLGNGSFYESPTISSVGTFSYYVLSGSAAFDIRATAAGTVLSIDNVSVREVVGDRSYKAAGAPITGTLTRAQLASGTSLVGYSGFSADNYLREPFSAALDLGTGEWTTSAWVNVPATLLVGNFPVTGSELVSDDQWTLVSANVSASGKTLTYTDYEGAAGSVGNSQKAPITIVAGRTYRIAVTAVNSLLSDFRVGFGGPWLFSVPTGSGTYQVITTMPSGVTQLYVYVPSTGSGTFTFSLVEVAPALIADRAHSSGAKLHLGLTGTGRLVAEAFDGTTTRTVTTSAAYNVAQWVKAEACYTTDGTLSIRMNGREVAVIRGAPLLTLNNASAVLTIGNSFALDAPFPGSLALLKLGATVPTPEQSVFMFEQEKQLFRSDAQSVLPDSGSIVDMAYDDATDRWVAVSAANESYWTGLVRNNVTPVPAGSFTRTVAASGIELAARSTTNPGADVTIPAYGLREELVRRAEAAARLSKELAIYDYVGGFTASTTNGSTAITSVAGLTYPASYIGARISGSGIPANTTIVAVSGTTIYLSAAATATATGVSISFLDFTLPVGMEAKAVMSAGALKQEGATKDFTRLYDGFIETIRFGVAPGATAWVQIQATRGTMQ